jgi:uncharacterized protein YkwD
LAAAAAGACTTASPPREPAALRLRAPDLTRPLRDTDPEPSRPQDPVEAAVFDQINADRRAAGRAAVAWDEGAARAARAFCKAQVHERTRGHFLTDGIPPYARTALAGVFGVQAENATAWLSSTREFQKSLIELALGSHADMMAERPPADGHRKAILDPDATHVGVGWAQEAGSFRMAQEFLTRRLSTMTLSLAAQAPVTIRVEGKAAFPYRIEFVTFALEQAPARLTKSEANARASYVYPEPRLAYVPEGRKSLRVVGAETDDRLQLQAGGGFSFRFTPPRAGLWTILVYTSEAQNEPRPGGLAVLWMEPAGAK